MDKLTIRTLAKELQLSVSTISKALRDSHEISAETKRKVLELAEKLNYTPNPYASSLRKKNSNTIAVVLPEVADSFFSLAINGIESVAREKGYHVLIYLTHENFAREQSILNDFKSGRVDGILISVSAETNNSDHINELINLGKPLVFFDRVCEDVDTGSIITNDTESSYEATCHLLQKGCKKIAFLYTSPDLSINKKRLEGYSKALNEFGLQPQKENIILCDGDSDSNYNIIYSILKNKTRPDGILACVEKLTTPIYLACKELKLAIPGNIKLVSFTNLPAALILSPTLTTVTQPAFEMGKAAAEILFKAIQKTNYNLKKEKIIIPSCLNVRDSTG